MKYLQYKPIKELSKFVKLIWILESDSPDDSFGREKILPDGAVEMVFHYADPFYTYFSSGEKMKQPKNFTIAQINNFIEIESDGNIGFISVRFYPWGAYPFMPKNSPKKLVDKVVMLEDVWNESLEMLIRKLKSASHLEKATIIQNYLLKHLVHTNRRKLDEITCLIQLILKTKGLLSVAKICDSANLSYKQLERRFTSTVGVSPKVFSKNTRFLHLCHNLKEYENKPLTGLAYELGYYDQAHFIKEFKAFSGLTPKEYFAEKNICFADF